MKSIRRCRTHATVIFTEKSLENRFLPANGGIGIQAQTIPIAFQADAAPDGIPHLAIVTIGRQNFPANRPHCGKRLLYRSVLFLPSGLMLLAAIHHVTSYARTFPASNPPPQRLSQSGNTVGASPRMPLSDRNAFAQSRTVANCFVQNLYIRRTADIQTFNGCFSILSDARLICILPINSNMHKQNSFS